MAEIIFVLVIASCRSAPSQRQCSCTIKATTKERLLSLRRRWWNTTRQTWTVGRCAKARRSLRAKITSDTTTASMKSYQVRNQSFCRGGVWVPVCPLTFALLSRFSLQKSKQKKAVEIQNRGHVFSHVSRAKSKAMARLSAPAESSLSCMFKSPNKFQFI